MSIKLVAAIFIPLEGHPPQCGGSTKKNHWFEKISKFLLSGFTILSLIWNVNLTAFAQEPKPSLAEFEGATAEVSESTPAGPETKTAEVAEEGAGTTEEIGSPGEAEEATSSTEETGQLAGTKETGKSAEKAEGSNKITLIFKDVDIRTVLHTLSYKSGVNIVAAEDVEGKVNIRLIDVPWETALEVILKNHGLASEKVGNIVRVITLASVAEEDLQNEVFVLNYSNAKDVAEAIKDTLTKRGSVKYDERTNTIIVTDIPTNLYKIRDVIRRLDRRTPQVAIEAKLIETTLDKDDKIGINWAVQVTASGAKRPTTLPFDRVRSPFSTTRGPEGGAGGVQEHSVVAEGLGHYLPVGNPSSDPPFPTSTLPAFPYVNASSFTFGTLDFSSFSAVLELLKSRTDTKIISNPTVVTLNNQEAKVTVSTVFNIPTYERSDVTGNMEVTGYTEREIGVILTVIPHVNEAGDIVVDLKPEVSAFLNWDTFGTGTNTIYAPRFSTRTAETQVMVKDGQTIAIGGLMKETASKYIKKVPILGDIPLLGELFKKTEDAIDTVDLLIFVTVRLVKEDRNDNSLMKDTEKKVVHGTKEISF